MSNKIHKINKFFKNKKKSLLKKLHSKSKINLFKNKKQLKRMFKRNKKLNKLKNNRFNRRNKINKQSLKI